MSPLAKILQSGFDVSLVDGCIEISPFSKLTPPQIKFLKLHKASIIGELSAGSLVQEEENLIRDWLAHIEETDPVMIAETLEQCRTGQEAKAYFLGRAKESPKPVITCGNCQHFECFNAHGRGAGVCNAYIQASGVGLWSNTPHLCAQFMQKTLYSPTNLCSHLTP